MTNDVSKPAGHAVVPGTTGSILHWALGYDLLLWAATLGRERILREKVLRLARLRTGESVLDVGCGTGTLAIRAKSHVGSAGTVCGIDASPEMIARATKKARKAKVDVAFTNAQAEMLPFPSNSFDVVLTSMMMHHLPKPVRQRCAGEIRRVLKPSGRVLIVDFGVRSRKRGSLFGHLHRHGHTKIDDIVATLAAAGLDPIERGLVGMRDLYFVLAVPRVRAGER